MRFDIARMIGIAIVNPVVWATEWLKQAQVLVMCCIAHRLGDGFKRADARVCHVTRDSGVTEFQVTPSRPGQPIMPHARMNSLASLSESGVRSSIGLLIGTRTRPGSIFSMSSRTSIVSM